jgi:Spy/CpxP family protein refolding chaperone
MMRDGGPMAMVRLALGRLGLSTEQRQQVKTILGNHSAEFQAIQDRAVPARRALADAIAAGDEAAIRQRSADLSTVQTDTALLAARVHGEIFKILTPEQQQKAQELRKQFESRMDQRRGRGARRGF